MPDANGKFQLQDFDAALVARGFDAFALGERYQLVNLGYRYLARKMPWSWEEATRTYVQPAGDATLDVVGGGTPLSMNSIVAVECVSDPFRGHLQPTTEEDFKANWLQLDLTAVNNQGTPRRYIAWFGNLYILPAPSQQVSIQVWFRQFLLDMVAVTDTPVTPSILDEVIVDCALVRCHRRAHELELAAEAQSRVDDAIADMMQDDVWTMEELQDRVLPDRQWL